jgi:uncharacterized membrane-anchored protein
MMSLLARIPRWLMFVLAGAIQIALIAVMVVDRARLLRQGTEVTLQTRPVDPRDFLRGDYVVLNYDISQLPAGALQGMPAKGDGLVYVRLARKDDGFHAAVSVHGEPVPIENSDVLIRGRVVSGTNCGVTYRSYCNNLSIKYGIERYFVPEGEGREIESARNEGKVSIVAAVAPGGRAAIKRLLLDGKQVYSEPIY